MGSGDVRGVGVLEGSQRGLGSLGGGWGIREGSLGGSLV